MKNSILSVSRYPTENLDSSCLSLQSSNLNNPELIELKRIIAHELIETVFQPVVCLNTGKVIAYEALSRGPKGSLFEFPKKMFEAAKKYNLLNELEYLCRTASIKNSRGITKTHLLFLNVDPSTLQHSISPKGVTKSFLKSENIPLKKIVLEITEKSAIADYNSFRKIVDYYRKQGYNIAVDDAGAGYSGLQMMVEIRPQWIKLDMSLIRNIDKNQYKKLFVKHFYQFALTANIAVIAEGVESLDELNELIDIGIPYAQGYYLSKPASAFTEICPELSSLLNKKNKENSYYFKNSPSVATVGEIVRFDKSIKKSTLGASVNKHFHDEPLIQGIVITENNSPIGLITRVNFNKFLSSQFGFSIYSKTPIEEIMNGNPLIIKHDISIVEASRMANSREDTELYDYVIVVKDGMYYGVVSVKLLLDKVIDMEIDSARNCNPLTKLPGNHDITSHLSEFTKDKIPFSAFYLDMDNFKYYNDTYGFIKGDRILVFFAELLRKILNDFSAESFLGHIGGDDFFIITLGGDNTKLCNSIIQEFDEKIKQFYSKKDRLANYSTNIKRKSPFVSISIAVLDNTDLAFNSTESVNNTLSILKAKCKKNPSSCFCISHSY